MQVILLEKMRNLGDLGDTVRVKPGYGRNYLIPYGKAVAANAENVRLFETKRAEFEAKAQAKLEEAQQLFEQLDGKSVTIRMRASEEGKLFGAVHAAEVLHAIETQLGVALPKQIVQLSETAVRQVGDYSADCYLHTDVTAVLAVRVEAL